MDKTPKYVVKTSGNEKLTPKLLNIDGSDDPFYRYKMRQLYVQVVGKGKMIKTNILNVDDVAKDLKVSPSYLTAYLGYETGAQFKYDAKKPDRQKAYISGDLDAASLTLHMKKFIQELVLCRYCNLPEITMFVKGIEISTSCRSCGGKAVLDNLREKFSQYILNHPSKPLTSKEERAVKKKQDEATQQENEKEEEEAPTPPKEKKEKTTEKKVRKKKVVVEEEDDDIEWSVPTDAESVAQRRQEAFQLENGFIQ